MRIDDIIIGDRARVSAGWLDDLERSIERHGVLHPIGVTQDNVLIFGFRRLMACKNLGMTEIPATVINIDPNDPAMALRLEQAENNIRRDFTPSEKVEIARKIEEAMGNRQGQRTELLQHVAEVEAGNTRDIAAAAVGMSGEQYRRAKIVVDQGDPETVEKMDSGEMSVRAAYMTVTGNEPEQRPARKKSTSQERPRYKIVLKLKDPAGDAKRIVESNEEYADALLKAIARLLGHDVEQAPGHRA